MHVDIHVLQSYGLGNLNRDNLGDPKEAPFGGVRRARISSQCQKRAARTYNANGHDNGTVRTRRSHQRVAEKLIESGVNEDRARAAARATLSAALNSGAIDQDPERQLLFLTADEIAALADAAMKHLDTIAPADGSEPTSKKVPELNKAFAGIIKNPTVRARDLALYGRMIAADNAEDRHESSLFVSHALSTHEIADEVDWFSAVDDLAPTDDASGVAAAHIGELGMNASTFYRHASIDAEQLLTNLDGDRNAARDAIDSFVKGFVLSVPSGKQHATAATGAPSLVLIEVREGSRSYVNAFENPVAPTNGALIPSVEHLDAFIGRAQSMWGDEGCTWAGWATDLDVDLPALKSVGGDPQKFSDIVEGAKNAAVAKDLAADDDEAEA